MIGRLPKDQAGTWHLISGNINRQCFFAISVIVEKLLTPARARTLASHLLYPRKEILA